MKPLWNLHVRKRGDRLWLVLYPFPTTKERAIRIFQDILLHTALSRSDIELSIRKVDVPGYTPAEIKIIDARYDEFFPERKPFGACGQSPR